MWKTDSNIYPKTKSYSSNIAIVKSFMVKGKPSWQMAVDKSLKCSLPTVNKSLTVISILKNTKRHNAKLFYHWHIDEVEHKA